MGHLLLTAPRRGMYLVLLRRPSSTFIQLNSAPRIIVLCQKHTSTLYALRTPYACSYRSFYRSLLVFDSLACSFNSGRVTLLDTTFVWSYSCSIQNHIPYDVLIWPSLSTFNRSTACYLHPLPLADSSTTDEIALASRAALGSPSQKEYIP